MANLKVIELVKAIAYNAINGKLAWKKSSEEGVFNATLKGYSVQVATLEEWDLDSEQFYTSYRIRLFDSQGELITELGPGDFTKDDFDNRYPHDTFQDLYINARSLAMGIDEAVDAILSQLSPLPSSNDDDIPF